MRILIYPFILIILVYCSCQKTADACMELSFDERQCGSDAFLTAGDPQTKAMEAEDYLRKKGIEVISADYDPNFNEIVCQACDICPTGLRFFIKVGDISEDKLLTLNLLNPELNPCP